MSAPAPLRAALIGVGHLGKEHARVLAEMEGVQLVAVADLDGARCREIAARLGCAAVAHARDLPSGLDAVSIAVPTRDHFAVAAHFLERGVPVLVEKPMTSTLEQARELTRLAVGSGVLLQVGHIERFNPVFAAIRDLEIHPRFIEAHRLAPYSFRSTDIGVVMDLMIHDLDLILHMASAPVTRVDAVGGQPLSGQEDIANARIEFATGCIANVTASRISLKRMRRLRVFATDSFISLDFDKKYGFVAKKAADFAERWHAFQEHSPAELGVDAAAAFADLIEMRELELDPIEPLKRELLAFVEAVRAGGESLVPPEHGLRAMELACRIQQEIARRGW